MTTIKRNHPNNIRLRELVEATGFSQAVALTIFNRGQVRPIGESGFKAWLAAPDSTRWRELSDAYLVHAEKVFAKKNDAFTWCTGALIITASK